MEWNCGISYDSFIPIFDKTTQMRYYYLERPIKNQSWPSLLKTLSSLRYGMAAADAMRCSNIVTTFSSMQLWPCRADQFDSTFEASRMQWRSNRIESNRGCSTVPTWQHNNGRAEHYSDLSSSEELFTLPHPERTYLIPRREQRNGSSIQCRLGTLRNDNYSSFHPVPSWGKFSPMTRRLKQVHGSSHANATH